MSLANKAVSLVSRHSPVVAVRVSTSRLTRMIAWTWSYHSVPAKQLPSTNTSPVRVAAPTVFVGGSDAIERSCGVGQRGDGVMQGGLVRFDLGDRMNAVKVACSKNFSIMHKIDAVEVALWNEGLEVYADDIARVIDETWADLRQRYGADFPQSVGGRCPF